MSISTGVFGVENSPEKRTPKKEPLVSGESTSSPPASCEYSDRILSRQQLVRLKQHRYNCVCSSLFDPFLQPYWNWLVLQLPLWMAPNLITILGLIVNVITSLILIYFSPDCKSPVPAWALILCALGLFIYQSLDAIDGKQARRTSSSSPLGELFDHGCDSISTVFVSLGVCISCRLGASLPLMFLQSFMAISLFYCAHWQTYVTGTLKFGLIDVTEAQIGIMIIHIITAIFGGDFWMKQSIPFTSVPFYVVYVFVALGGAIPALYSEFKTILYKGAGKNGSSIAGTSVLSPVIPFAMVIAPAIIIAAKSEEHIYAENPALYIMTFGLIAAKVTNRLVVAHMTKSEMDYFDLALLGPILMFLNQYFDCFIREKYVLWISLLIVSAELYRYSGKVCLEICDSLNIRLFQIDVSGLSSAANKRPSTTALDRLCICKLQVYMNLVDPDDLMMIDCEDCPSCSSAVETGNKLIAELGLGKKNEDLDRQNDQASSSVSVVSFYRKAKESVSRS